MSKKNKTTPKSASTPAEAVSAAQIWSEDEARAHALVLQAGDDWYRARITYNLGTAATAAGDSAPVGSGSATDAESAGLTAEHP